MPLIPTASQTVGPFFNFGLTTDQSLGKMGTGMRLAVRVFDGAGEPTPGDAMIELWDGASFGRLETGPDGVCEFELNPCEWITALVFARGLLGHLWTRIYFGAPVDERVPEDRRHTLQAKLVDGVWRFDIHLQGPAETVFFDL